MNPGALPVLLLPPPATAEFLQTLKDVIENPDQLVF